MTTKGKRSPAAVLVSPLTEWTDYAGIHLLFGLRRSTAYHLSNEGSIKSVSLRHEHEKRGKRLFHVPSIREYLNSKLIESAPPRSEQDSEIASNGGQQPDAAKKSGNSLGTL
jgi:hypothetical protein